MTAHTQTKMAAAERATPASVLMREARRVSRVWRMASSCWLSSGRWARPLSFPRRRFLSSPEDLMLFSATLLMTLRRSQWAIMARIRMMAMRMGRSISQLCTFSSFQKLDTDSMAESVVEAADAKNCVFIILS